MPRVPKVEIYAIQWLTHKGHDPAYISKELKIPEKTILSVLEKNENTNNENKIKTASNKVNGSGKNLMINETAIKRTKSVSIMTEAASQRNDEALKNIPQQNKNSKTTYNPYG